MGRVKLPHRIGLTVVSLIFVAAGVTFNVFKSHGFTATGKDCHESARSVYVSGADSPIIVRHGELWQGSLQIHNQSSSKVLLDQITTSCECLSVKPDSALLEPYDSKDLAVLFDTRLEHDFRGALKVKIVGKDHNGEVLMIKVMDINVE